MDLFSSLKTAYDSIGSEISKSFDSSDFEKHSTPVSKSDTQPRAEPLDIPALIQSGHDRSHTHSQAHQPSESESVNTAPINEGNDFDTSWGQWEDTPTRNTPQQQENSSPPLVRTPPTNEAPPPPVRTPPTDEAPLVKTPPTDEAPLVKTPPTNEAPLVKTPPTNEAPLVRTPATNEATDGVPNKPVATSTPAKGTPSKGKSSLEALSREDLIKYIKKQAQLLQKSKAKCEELSRECEETRKKATPTPIQTTPTDLLEELQIVRSERDVAVQVGKSLKQEKQELSDEVQMLTEANSKLKLFCQEVQCQESAMAELKRSGDERSEQFSQEKSELNSQLVQLRAELEEAKKEKTTPSEDVSLEQNALQVETLDSLLHEKTAQLSSLETEQCQLIEECDGLKNRNVTLTEQLSDSSTKLEELQSRYQDLEKDNEQFKYQLSETISKLESAQTDKESELISNLEEQLSEVRGQLEAAKSDMTSEQETHREETRKLKAFVLKLKKQLKEKMDSSGSEAALREEGEGLRVAMETVTAEKEELAVQLSEAESNREELESQVQELSSSLAARDTRIEELVSTSEQLSERVSSLEEGREVTASVTASELASTQADLATAHSLSNTQQLTIDKLQASVASVRDELEREQLTHSETRDKLTTAQKGAQSSTLMNLELQDFQRSIRSLEEDVAGKGAELEATRKESHTHLDKIEQLKKELECTGAQRGAEVETVSKLKALLVRTKKELAEGRRKEVELGEHVDKLTAELESGRGQFEEHKVELSELGARLHCEQLAAQSSMETLQQTVRGLELKTAGLQSQLSTAQASLTMVQGEYDSYKVRVHSVLKQRSTAAEQVEINPEIKKSYEDEITKLTASLQNTKSQLSVALSDHDELLSEHDALTGRHDSLLQEAQTTRERLTLRLREVESQYSRESLEQRGLVEQLRQEIKELTTAFTNQITGLQQEHKKAVLGLREELHSTHSQLSRLQEEADNKVFIRANSQETRGVAKRGLSLEVKPGVVPSESRTSGVGMDRSELESSYPPTPFSREDSSASLERLLSDTAGTQTERLSETELALQKNLQSSRVKIDHVTELLRESEASSVRLSEQAKLLKEEIRRLERNQEREGVSNMEYLKNVVLKFMHAQDVKDKEGLVPIITKLLQLSPQEVKFVQDTIQGDGDVDGPPGSAVGPPASAAGSKLSNYIHRWTGY